MKNHFYLLLTLSVLFFQTVAFSQSKPQFSLRLDSLLNTLETNNKAFSSVTITQNGQVVYSHATGFIDDPVKNQVKANPGTRYRIGSISKMFTSVMILQLVEEQKLSLDTPLSGFFKKIPNAEKITISDLLDHHSGLYSFTNSEDYVKWMTEPRTQKQLLDLFASQEPVFAPGEKGEYSNTNFVILGYIIEEITHKTYQENLTERITGRIGLKNTGYGSKINHSGNEASSFEFIDNKWVVQPETDMSIPHGAGAVTSTTPDLTSFIDALFNGKLLQKETLNLMTNMKDGFGLGIFKIPFYEKSAFGHNGSIDGFVSSLGYFPDEKVAVAFCSNGMNYSMNDILIGILSIYFEKPYSLPVFNKAVDIAADKLAAYEGEYTSEQIPIGLTIKREGDKLTGQGTGQPAFPLEAVSETEFRFDKAGIVIVFSILASGEVDGFTLKQGGEYTFKKVAKP